MNKITTAAVVLFALIAPVLASAAEPTTSESGSDAMFPEGTEYFSLKLAYQNERNGMDRFLASTVFSKGGYFIDNAAAEIQFVGYWGHDTEQDPVGAGLNLSARYHFINVGRFSLYGDVLGGLFCMTDDWPIGGTAFNFTYAGGPGVSYKIRDGLFLDGGIRFQHVSNFFIEGRDRNPIFNSFGGYIGVTWWR
jgi:opacity protein-like surface antigen